MLAVNHRLVRVSVAARIVGVCIKTLHRWDSTGKLTATARTAGKLRRYETRVLATWLAGNRQEKSNKGKQENNSGNKRQERVLIYARVSSNKQKNDLIRQLETLEKHCRKKGYRIAGIYRDTASGLNDRRPGLLR
ncbi:MAG: recombinase family protein, partial [Candidatus Hodarchaeales archaeon]